MKSSISVILNEVKDLNKINSIRDSSEQQRMSGMRTCAQNDKSIIKMFSWPQSQYPMWSAQNVAGPGLHQNQFWSLQEYPHLYQ